MATKTTMGFGFAIVFFLLVSQLTLNCHARPLPSTSCTYNAIYQFGDSLSDTGNLILEIPSAALSRNPFANLPYGETYFNKPTGRCSNGLLIIDYLATSLNLPFLKPYLQGESRYPNGVNFAVAGSTALSAEALLNNGIMSPITNSSLSVQLDWFNAHVDSVVHNVQGKTCQIPYDMHACRVHYACFNNLFSFLEQIHRLQLMMKYIRMLSSLWGRLEETIITMPSSREKPCSMSEIWCLKLSKVSPMLLR